MLPINIVLNTISSNILKNPYVKYSTSNIMSHGEQLVATHHNMIQSEKSKEKTEWLVGLGLCTWRSCSSCILHEFALFQFHVVVFHIIFSRPKNTQISLFPQSEYNEHYLSHSCCTINDSYYLGYKVLRAQSSSPQPHSSSFISVTSPASLHTHRLWVLHQGP